jgi:hypothetical protein
MKRTDHKTHLVQPSVWALHPVLLRQTHSSHHTHHPTSKTVYQFYSLPETPKQVPQSALYTSRQNKPTNTADRQLLSLKQYDTPPAAITYTSQQSCPQHQNFPSSAPPLHSYHQHTISLPKLGFHPNFGLHGV